MAPRPRRSTSAARSSTRRSASSPARASTPTRVSDIADEAGVAYGLVYHYFKSKDEVLNELFTERWSLLLAAIEEADGAGDQRRARSSTRSPASSSTPTATTRS